MKVTRRIRSFFAAFVVALTALLGNFSGWQQAHGAQVGTTNALPDSLPIGSRAQFLDWIATNTTAWLWFSMTYTNTIGQSVQTFYPPHGRQTNLTSYASFCNHMCQDGMHLLQNLSSRTGNMAVASDSKVTFIAILSHDLPDRTEPVFIAVNTNIGYLSQITSNSFVGVPYRYAYAIIPVKELQRLAIDVGTNDEYHFEWTKEGGSYYSSSELGFQPPLEYLRTNMVVLGEWYSTNGYRARFTINANGQSRTYTQYGESLDITKLTCAPPTLNVRVARGSDVLIESFMDFNETSANKVLPATVTTILTNLDWSLGVSNMQIPIRKDLPQQFFRATTR